MNREEVILITLAIQVAIQVALYLGTSTMFKNLIRRPVLTASLSYKWWGLESRQQMANSLVTALLLAYNLLISVVVLKFTNSSALAGITNMGASVVVAGIMWLEFSKIGRHYIEVPKDKVSKIQMLLKKLKGERNGSN